MSISFVYMNNEYNVGRGAGYVAASIVRAGYTLKFYDSLYIPIDKIAKEVIKNKSEFLMISTMTMIFQDAVELIHKVKEQNRSIKVLVGGIHPTIMGAKLLDQYDEIDYICIGEGETAAVEFLNNFKNKPDLHGIRNIIFRDNGKIVANNIREAEDLSLLPEFPWEYFNKKSIIQENEGFLYVTASRGCPYACTYCCNGIYLKLYKNRYLRFRPVKEIIDELKFLKKKFNPLLFYFGDEMILWDPGYAIDLFKSIKKELNIYYGCMARVEYINQNIINLMRETGCKYVAMGIECGDENFRKNQLNRHMGNDQIISAFKLVKDAGIFTSSFNMIGYPFDYDDTLTEETIKLNKTVNPDFVQISIFYPLPGTKLYDYCIEKKLIDDNKISAARHYFSESVLKGKDIATKREELHRYFNKKEFDLNYFVTDLNSFVRIYFYKIKRDINKILQIISKWFFKGHIFKIIQNMTTNHQI